MLQAIEFGPEASAVEQFNNWASELKDVKIIATDIKTEIFPVPDPLGKVSLNIMKIITVIYEE